MRLSNYLIEKDYEKNAAEIIRVLERDCMPFINEAQDVFWRGLKGGVKKDTIYKIMPRSNRKPKDLPPEMSKALDDKFKKYFGWRVRSEGAFATTKKGMTMQYGAAVMFFPIGKKYKYVWSEEIKDLYLYAKGEFGDRRMFYDDQKPTREDLQDIDEFVKTNYVNDDLYSADEIEVSFYCPEGYYAVYDVYQVHIERHFSI